MVGAVVFVVGAVLGIDQRILLYDQGGSVSRVVDLGSDPLNCGAINARCGAGEQCFDGTCLSIRPRARLQPHSNGGLIVIPGNNSAELRSQFVSSRGAWASAQTMARTATPASTCSLDGTTNDCLLYTGDCVGAGGCPPDPNAATSSEISCWCRPMVTMQMQSAAPRTPTSFESTLLIDQNVDRRTDQPRSSTTPAGAPTGFVRYRAVNDTTYRLEWEDMNAPPNGDFNDFISTVTMRDCDPGNPFSTTTSTWGDTRLQCLGRCAVGDCPQADAQPNDLRLSMAMYLDDPRLEGDREPRGELLVLSILAENNGATKEYAFCPVVTFRYDQTVRACGGGHRAADPVQNHRYGPASSRCVQGKVVPGSQGFEPMCGSEEPACESFPVAMAREQLYGVNTCAQGANTRVGLGDRVELESGNACGASSLVLDYQLSLRDIDSQIHEPGQSLRARGFEKLAGSPAMTAAVIERVDVYVFDGFQASEPFHCPSGVNVQFDVTDPAFDTQQGAELSRARKFTWWNEVLAMGPSRFTLLQR